MVDVGDRSCTCLEFSGCWVGHEPLVEQLGGQVVEVVRMQLALVALDMMV